MRRHRGRASAQVSARAAGPSWPPALELVSVFSASSFAQPNSIADVAGRPGDLLVVVASTVGVSWDKPLVTASGLTFTLASSTNRVSTSRTWLTDSTARTLTVSCTNGYNTFGTALIFRGANIATPLDVNPSAAQGASVSSLTTTRNGAIAVLFGATLTNYTLYMGATGWDIVNAKAAGNEGALVAVKRMPTAGATGAVPMSPSSSLVTQTLAIRPQAAA